MRGKVGLFIYTVIILCVPQPPNLYTLCINLLGMVVACVCTLINIMYFRKGWKIKKENIYVLPAKWIRQAEPFRLAQISSAEWNLG